MSDKKRGRPAIPTAERRRHRITIRLNDAELLQLTQLKEQSSSASDGEVVRAAIAAQLGRPAASSVVKSKKNRTTGQLGNICPVCGATGYDSRTRFCLVCM